jgi:selenocysteine lyase/cysteine desulfurase
VSFTKKGLDPPIIQASLARQAINISVSSGSSTLLDMGPRELPQIARASVHYYNTEDEVDRAVAAVDAV